MDYFKIYYKLIDSAKLRSNTGYVERHHIVPRCRNGSDEPENLVELTPEEHFLAHLLLIKMYPSDGKLVSAVAKMCQPVSGRPTRKLYGWVRRKFAQRMSQIQKGEGNSQYGSMWITDGSESRKVSKDAIIPKGWRTGRVIAALRKPNRICICCGKDLGTRRRRYCDEHLDVVKKENAKKGLSKIRHLRPYQGKFFITDGTNDRIHPVDQPIPEGYVRGRSNNRHKTGGRRSS